MLRVEIRDKHIYLTRTVVDILCQFRQLKQAKNENGGIILGQTSKDEQQILVCRASVPGSQERSGRLSFHRDRRKAQQIIEYEFYNSDGRNTYLGEWHTHPAKEAVPSSQDISMIMEQFATNEMRIEFILLLIVTWEELFVGLHDGQTMYSATVRDFCATL